MRADQPSSPFREHAVPDTPRFLADVEGYLKAQMRGTRATAGARPSRRRRVLAVAGVAILAVVAALAVVVLGPVTGGRPAAVARAEAFVLPDGTTVHLEEFFDPANFDRLLQVFTDHGAELVINERPVAGPAVGRVFGVSIDFAEDSSDSDSRIVDIAPGDRVEVEVGRAARTDEQVNSEGLTLFEVFPTLPAAIDRGDPVGTGQALDDLGFQVRWVLLDVSVKDGEFNNTSQDVSTPPPGTVIVSVFGPNAEWTDVDPATETLLVELATPEEAAQLGHGA